MLPLLYYHKEVLNKSKDFLRGCSSFNQGVFILSKFPVKSSTPGTWSLTTERVVAAGVLVGITILMGIFPVLGFIPVPNLTANATIEHIPTILGGVLEGPVVGMVTGFFFGLISFLRSPIPLFKDPLVAFVPRILIGLTAWLTYAGLRRVNRDMAAIIAGIFTFSSWLIFIGLQKFNPTVAAIVAGLFGLASWLIFIGLQRVNRDTAAFVAGMVGAATNTVFVLTFGIWRQDAPFAGVPPPVIIVAVLPQAIAEALLAGILSVIIVRAVEIVRGGFVRAPETKSRDELPY